MLFFDALGSVESLSLIAFLKAFVSGFSPFALPSSGSEGEVGGTDLIIFYSLFFFFLTCLTEPTSSSSEASLRTSSKEASFFHSSL